MTFDIIDDIAEIWQASVQLRFVERRNNLEKITKSKPRRILQQLWTSNKGNREWRDIPIVKEE